MQWCTALEDSSILIVDDEEANGRFFKRLLTAAGFHNNVVIRDPRQARDAFAALDPDLVILDLHMPHMDGFQVMEALQPLVPEESFLPILVITGDLEPSVRIRCLAAGAKDFMSKPFRGDELILRIRNLLETRQLHRHLERRNQTLALQVEEENSKLRETQLEILQRLAVAAEYRDDVTGKHAERVGVIAGCIGKELGLSEEQVGHLRQAAPLHDVGKIGIPDSILLSPDRLTERQFETMKTHTTIGGLILSRDSFSLLGFAREIALTHHEWFNGSGYPSGLSGQAIPLSGRIVAVADVFDSVVHARAYKPAIPVHETLEIMTRVRGEQFDPEVFDPFVQMVRSGRIAAALNAPNELDAPAALAAHSVEDAHALLDAAASNLAGPARRLISLRAG